MEGLNFESAMARLEEIVEQLESGELSLESSLAIFEEGVRLSLYCQQELEKTDGKVQRLLRKLNGEFALEDMEA
ncbi:MAG TPA: exodeoxyribonuclease VII small subunit [Syntrophomonadaceae bacterium]|jgi:exodeoxyribonuclease VII small subunit|nr:exodeoxyribonuclease VII small subunit [Syntrophomonadaceae bacterium]